MAIKTVWIPGTVTQLERADSAPYGTRYGWGMTFTGFQGETYWFHLAIPVVTSEEALKLKEVALLFKTSYCFVRAVHLYDGVRKIHEFGGLSLNGDHSAGVTPGVNNWTVDDTPLSFGLGVSVAVEFQSLGGGWHPPIALDITFFGAGATFETSPASATRSSRTS
jgi:hypothetical protein